MIVKFVDLKEQYESIKDDIFNGITEVMENTSFIQGPQVRELEEKFADYCNVKFGVGVASGTDAITIACKALGIGPGDEVITVANTYIATALGISFAGASPVLVDIDPVSYNIDPRKVEPAITAKTKAIIPVHLYGQIADMNPIMEIARKHDLKVIEDACQAHGADYKGQRAGSIGDISCFSFFPSKNLGAYGDGGMILTNEEDLSQKARMLREYGQLKKYHHEHQGHNSRLDTIQAAVLLAKLPHLDSWNEKRRECAQLYNELLSGLDVVIPVEGKEYRHIYHLYVVRTKNRDELLEYLKSKEIFCGIHYPIPIHLQNAYKSLPYEKGSFPVTEEYAAEILSLPMFPELKKEQIRYVVESINRFLLESK